MTRKLLWEEEKKNFDCSPRDRGIKKEEGEGRITQALARFATASSKYTVIIVVNMEEFRACHKTLANGVLRILGCPLVSQGDSKPHDDEKGLQPTRPSC